MYTNFENALLELLKGRKIRNCNWDKTEYIKLENGELRDNKNFPCDLALANESNIRYQLTYQWEVLPTPEELLIVKGKAFDVAKFCYEIEHCENCPMCKYCREIEDTKNDYFIDALTCNGMQPDMWFSKYTLTINEMWDKLNKEE